MIEARWLVWLMAAATGVMLLSGCSGSTRQGANLSGFGAFELMTAADAVTESGSPPRVVALAVVEGGHASPGSEPVLKLVRPTAAWREDVERRERLRGWVRTYWLRESAPLRTAGDVVDAASSQGADAVLVMTFDSSAWGRGGLLSLMSLGLFPDATTTGDLNAEAVLVDVRAKRVLDRWNSTDTGWQPANAWTALEASEQVRARMERRAVVDAAARLERWLAERRGEVLPAQGDGWLGAADACTHADR